MVKFSTLIRSVPYGRRIVFQTVGARLLWMVLLICMSLFYSLTGHAQVTRAPRQPITGLAHTSIACNLFQSMYGTHPYSGATQCYTIVVPGDSTGCPDVANQRGAYLPSITALVAITPATGDSKGAILLHDGSDGTTFFNAGPSASDSYASEYSAAGFTVVQLAWSDSWHNNALRPPTKSILDEACRPASVMYHVFTQLVPQNGKKNCAQGHSNGSAAIAYSLAWYGAYRGDGNGFDYLDSVLFTSGPTLSNVEKGCHYAGNGSPENDPVTVCGGTSKLSCTQGPSPWKDCPEYNNGTQIDCTGSTNHPLSTLSTAQPISQSTLSAVNNCNNWRGDGSSTGPFNVKWRSMSLVQAPAQGGIYDYPNTAWGAFLCTNLQAGTSATCASGASLDCPNNSAAQGWLYLSSLKTDNTTHPVYGVDHCSYSEQIWVSGATIAGSGSTSAFTQSVNTMLDSCTTTSNQPH
jgi:hypothetical protein